MYTVILGPDLELCGFYVKIPNFFLAGHSLPQLVRAARSLPSWTSPYTIFTRTNTTLACTVPDRRRRCCDERAPSNCIIVSAFHWPLSCRCSLCIEQRMTIRTIVTSGEYSSPFQSYAWRYHSVTHFHFISFSSHIRVLRPNKKLFWRVDIVGEPSFKTLEELIIFYVSLI